MSQIATQASIADFFHLEPLGQSEFGLKLKLRTGVGLSAALSALEQTPKAFNRLLNDANGLLVISGLAEIAVKPSLLVGLSRQLGPEVEDYRQTLTPANRIHPDVPEILVLSNKPPSAKQPPPRPEPPLTDRGEFPLQFPHRRGWHTDQSFRRPPPDISLFYCGQPAPIDQAQTLYANGVAAYQTLPRSLREQADQLTGLHALIGTGRTEQAVRNNEPVLPLLAHQKSQPHPVVRNHPDTGKPALFLCEAGQMDWVDGPFIGLAPGPDNAGAKLLYAIMQHYTSPEFVYTHHWRRGDLVIYDNRSTIHCATWYDAERYQRLMWRTTVMGNPGVEYANEPKSWLPEQPEIRMSGLENYRQ